jgi:predicted transcriptional regulator of viral defense system
MKLNLFFSQNPVFRVTELRSFLKAEASGNPRTCNALLAYYRKRGRIVMLCKGLYAVVPLGTSTETVVVDPFVIAAKIADDSVLAYHTALQYHGRAYSQLNRYVYLSAHRARSIVFKGFFLRQVNFPSSLIRTHDEHFDIVTQERQNTKVRVTSLERTLVDVLDRPDQSGGWEEVWRSLEAIEYFETDRIIEYVIKLDNSTTAAKVGYFLEQHKNSLMIKDSDLAALEPYRPKRPHYFQRANRSSGDKFVARWNLVVPAEIVNKTWEEIA